MPGVVIDPLKLRLAKVPTEVMFGCAAVNTVPSMLPLNVFALTLPNSPTVITSPVESVTVAAAMNSLSDDFQPKK